MTMEIYHVYYYADGEELSLGYFLREEDADKIINEWFNLHPFKIKIKVQ